MIDLIGIGWTIVGIIITAIVTVIVIEFLPNKLRFSVQFNVRRLKKLFRPPTIEITLVAKTGDLTLQELPVEELVSEARRQLSRAGFNVAESGNTLSSSLTLGNTRTQVEFAPSVSIVEGDEIREDGATEFRQHQFVSQIQLSMSAQVKYHALAEQFLELSEAQQQILGNLGEQGKAFQRNRVLTCKLNSLYELTGILNKYNIDMLSANFERNHIDISGDKVVLYSDNLTGQLLSFLRKMIVMYY